MPLVDPRAAGDPANVLLATLVRVIEAHGVPYTFTGSFSLGFWTEPRSSKDIDIVLLLDSSKRAGLLQDLAKEGLEVAPDALGDLERVSSTPLGLRLPTGGRIIVELLVPEAARKKLTERIVGRAKVMPFPGLPGGMRIITAEDLIVYKLLLFRDGSRPSQTDDLKHIRDLVARRKDELDFGYIYLSLSVDETVPRAELAKRKRWFDKTLADLGVKRGRRS
jgi:hypothetical protein